MSNPHLQGEYTFLPQEHILFGVGSVNQLADEVKRLNCQRAIIITGHSLATQTDVVAKVEQALGPLHSGTYPSIRQHAPMSGITQATAMARSLAADILISVGGGSPIDAAKAVVNTLLQERNTIMPHIAIPTTLSAAEFSHLVGVTNEEQRVKAGFADARLAPTAVILDANLTLATPMQLWLSSGIRALDHAVETLYAPAIQRIQDGQTSGTFYHAVETSYTLGTHPINDILALEAIRLLFKYLPASMAQPNDLDTRTQLQLAAWMSFFGEVNTPLGLSHNIGRRIGATYNVPHGITSCITLPHVMRATGTQHTEPLARIAQALQLPNAKPNGPDSALAAANAVSNLIAQLGLPQHLRDVGINESELHSIAVATVGEGSQTTQIEALLQRML